MASSGDGAGVAVELEALSPEECARQVSAANAALFSISNVPVIDKLNIAMGLPGTRSSLNQVVGLHGTPAAFKAAAALVEARVAAWKYAVARDEAAMTAMARVLYEEVIASHRVSRGNCTVEGCTFPRMHLVEASASAGKMCFSVLCDHHHVMGGE